MTAIMAARAFCNNEVGYLAWTVTGKIPGCLGFEVTRVYLNADDTPARGADGTPDRVKTAAYVAFTGQRNPDWNVQDTGVWPVQKMSWRDLTLRKRRDNATRRPDEVRVRYEIRPVGDFRPGMTPVPSNGREKVHDKATGTLVPAYQGKPRPLGYLDDPVATNPIHVTTRRGPFRSTFTNGILAAQWLRNVLMEDGVIEKGELLKKLQNPEDKHRRYLAGDVLPLLHELFDRPGSFRLGLYELEDKELERLILDNGPRCRLILSNTGKSKTAGWDMRNKRARDRLQSAGIDVQPRMFNNNVHIGHNKFVVHLASDGSPKAVFTGSTNWTSTGVAGQTNNALLIEDEAVARVYLDYWERMHADLLPLPHPLSADMPGTRQGATFRAANATSVAATLGTGARVTLWFSPNMKQRQKPSTNPPLPPDLEHAYRLMRLAKQAIFFLAFYPGQRGKDCIIGEAIEIGRKDGQLLVMGAVSSPQAMPNYVPKPRDGDEDDDEEEAGQSPATFRDRRVSIIRASRIEDENIVGDLGREVLSAGRAIIHDKIVVIDPRSENCSVILGSHNLGFKASYSNDENLVIVEGDRALAEAYMVHVLDVYDHYRFRAVQSDLERQGKKGWSGFLQVTDAWQDRHLDPKADALAHYLVA